MGTGRPGWPAAWRWAGRRPRRVCGLRCGWGGGLQGGRGPPSEAARTRGPGLVGPPQGRTGQPRGGLVGGGVLLCWRRARCFRGPLGRCRPRGTGLCVTCSGPSCRQESLLGQWPGTPPRCARGRSRSRWRSLWAESRRSEERPGERQGHPHAEKPRGPLGPAEAAIPPVHANPWGASCEAAPAPSTDPPVGARPGLPGLPAMRSAPTAPASLRKWPSHCRRHSRHHANSVQPGLGSPKRLSCSAVPGATRVLGTRRGRQTQRKDSATRRPGGGSCPAAGRSPQGRMLRSGRPRLPGSTAWTEPAGHAPAPAGLGARGACRARAGTAPHTACPTLR